MHIKLDVLHGYLLDIMMNLYGLEKKEKNTQILINLNHLKLETIELLLKIGMILYIIELEE